MGTALAAAFKKIWAKFGKKIIASLVKGAKRGTQKMAGMMRDAVSGKTQDKSDTGGKKKKKKGVGLVLSILMLFVLVTCIILSAVLCVAFLPMIAVVGLAYEFVNNTSRVSNSINYYWEVHEEGYPGYAENATETDKLLYLLDYDDFWENIQSEFVFNRDTMRLICRYAEESQYCYSGEIEAEVVVYSSEDVPILDIDADEPIDTFSTVYDSNTPVYLDSEGYQLSWQDLYAVLTGCTDTDSVPEARVKAVADVLCTHVESEEEKNAEDNTSGTEGSTEETTGSTFFGNVAERIKTLISNLYSQLKKGGNNKETEEVVQYTIEEIRGGEYVEESHLQVTGNDGVYQMSGNNREDGNTGYFTLQDKDAIEQKQLYYTRFCPVYELAEGESIRTWYGVSDGSTFTMDNEYLKSSLSEMGYTSFNVNRSMANVLKMPNGYEHAVRISNIMGNGTVSVSSDSDDMFLTLFGNDTDFVTLMLSIFNVELSGGGANNFFGSYTDTGDYVLIDSYNGGPEVVWWSQNWYPDAPFGNSTVRGCGCGPTSLAIVYSSLTGDIVNPPAMAKWCYENGYGVTNSAGQTVGAHSMFSSGAEQLGLRVDYMQSNPNREQVQTALDYLDKGDLIVVIVGSMDRDNSIFTGAGHFLVIRGQTPDGDILLADPQHSDVAKNTDYSYPISDLMEILNRGSYGTGRIWAIGYDN